jgi:pimeloyl-ACP methyl ester carboxylesterase
MGSFTQGAFEGTFDLRRTAPVQTVPRPFLEDSVTINGDGFVLAGTFTVPPGEGPFPAVILLTGSGQQTRDENVFGFEVFRVLADSLAMDGIAVLRFDDRGTGGSTGMSPVITDSILALDACGMLDLARGLDGVDPARVGFLGHSEGAIVAFMAASLRPDETAFVVSMSGPSVRGYELLVAQIEGLSRMAGQPEEEIAEDVANQILLMDAVIDGTAPAVAESIVRSALEADLAELTQEQLAVYGDLDAYVETSVSQTMITLLSPWFRNFITTDPLDYLGGFDAPVLALLGELDVQVPADLDEPPISEALAGRPGSTVIVFPGANHLFQPAVTGAVEEYQGLPREFVPGFTSTVSEWILSVPAVTPVE